MQPVEIKNQRILISVLNWGMGHVSRSIGLLNQLIEQGNSIVIACDNDQEKIFKEYFSNVEYIVHEGYPFHFKGKGNFAFDLMKDFKSLQKRMRKEQNEVELIVSKRKIDIVLSDHRYGFYSKYVLSIFVTHQFNLPTQWYQVGANKFHHKLIEKFNTVWIMDYSDSRLAGKLSRSDNNARIEYIGPYSRFMTVKSQKALVEKSVIIASGPVIYAQQFIDECLDVLDVDKSIVVICTEEIKLSKSVKRISDSWKAQDAEILTASHLYSRSGYSTIMDLEFLCVEAILKETPGQAEQVYLASIHQ